MNGPDTTALRDNIMVVETVAHLAVAATLLTTSPYTPMHYSPAEMAIHAVNDACARGRLGMIHSALTQHLR